MTPIVPATGPQTPVYISDTDRICTEAKPLILSCIKKFPLFCRKAYKQEMYNTAIVAILENYDRYDPAKGSVAFFYEHIMSALHKFVANEVFGFSSYGKYHDYNAIRNVIPEVDFTNLTEDDYEKIATATGLKKVSVQSALNDSFIGNAVHFETGDFSFIKSVAPDVEEQMCTSELESAIAMALKGLYGSDLEFIYDLCGFDGRPVLTPWKLQRKYGLTPTQYDTYLRDLKYKLLGSRTLRRYMGRLPLDQEYLIR